jgi:hypothetical protein
VSPPFGPERARPRSVVYVHVSAEGLTAGSGVARVEEVGRYCLAGYACCSATELTAFGSPVRPLMVTVILTHGVLLVAFGVGVLRASRRKSLSWVGGLLIASGFVGFPAHTVWAMSSRGMETGFNDTMHASLSAVFSVLVIAAMAVSAVAYPGWFRVYALATIAVVVGFGMASSLAIQGIKINDTPWAGGFERINAYAYFAWLVVLAVTVMRREMPAMRLPTAA